jgi:hypothetical protein
MYTLMNSGCGVPRLATEIAAHAHHARLGGCPSFSTNAPHRSSIPWVTSPFAKRKLAGPHGLHPRSVVSGLSSGEGGRGGISRDPANDEPAFYFILFIFIVDSSQLLAPSRTSQASAWLRLVRTGMIVLLALSKPKNVASGTAAPWLPNFVADPSFGHDTHSEETESHRQ